MDIYEYINEMNDFIEVRDWNGLESKFKEISISLAGVEKTLEISKIEVSGYQKILCKRLSIAIEKAKTSSARAIYYEYDLDNDWQSNFFICQDYISIKDYKKAGDDDWACDWLDEVESTDFKLFGELYEVGFDKTSIAKGANLYLIARTTSAFGRCCEEYFNETFAICLAFHDQNPITRIYEPIH